jgi:hypothetical protein
MGKRHNRRWKEDNPIPNPGKRAEAQAKSSPTQDSAITKKSEITQEAEGNQEVGRKPDPLA